MALLLVVIFTFLVAALRADGALAHVAFVGTLVVVFLVFPTTVETLSRGKSLGQVGVRAAHRARRRRADQLPARVRARARRASSRSTRPAAAPAFFSAMLSSRGKRLGDYAAGTYVVRERIRLRLAPPPLMPPELAGWARAADVASLPTGLALAVRQFLARSPGLDPASRASVGSTLAQQVAPYVAPPPPPAPRPRRSSRP